MPYGTEPGLVMGTVGYMSPEQVRGKDGRPPFRHLRLGTILYEMVTGKQTFRKPTSAETMTAILNEDPPSISQVTAATPPGLQRVAHRCLEKPGATLSIGLRYGVCAGGAVGYGHDAFHRQSCAFG